MQTREIDSQFTGYRMYIKNGDVVVQGEGKLGAFVALFYLSDVQNLIHEYHQTKQE